MPPESDLSYCAQEVQRHDPERYATVLFAPAPRREGLFALYAFNLEVAKTAEVVSETMLGHIRLQWWREAIAEIYEKEPRQHAVIQPLAAAVRQHGLTRSHFDRLIDAREADLEPEAPASLADLEAYAEATSGLLLCAAVEILCEAGDDETRMAAARAARSIGMAWALVGLVRAVPFHAEHKRLYLPTEQVAATGLDVQALFELKSTPELREIARHLLARARHHLQEARGLGSRVPRAAHPALLLAGLTARHIRRLERANSDPFAAAVAGPLDGMLWRLALSTLRRRY